MFRATGLVAVGVLVASACGGDDGGDPVLRSKVYVADEGSGTISVIDEADATRVATIDLADDHGEYGPHNVQVAPDGRSVWVAAPPAAGHTGHGGAEAPEQAIVIDPARDRVIGRVELGVDLHVAHVVVDDAGEHAYVTANEGNAVLDIDAQGLTVVGRFDLGADHGPHGMRLCAGKLYVANMTAMSLSIVDPATGTVDEVALGGIAVQTACVPGGRWVFVSLYDTREVVRYEVATGELVRIALPSGSEGPVQLYPSPDGTRLYVCDQGILLDRPASNRVYEVDVATATVAATIEVGRGAHGVVVSEDGTRAYVTNIAEATVSIVDTASRAVVSTVPVGASPNGIGHWHVTGGMP
jgi:YVTN family beta-propeller protein